MTIKLELPPETEADLRAAFARHDEATVRRLLADAAYPNAKALLHTAAASTPSSVTHLDAILDRVAEVAGTNLPTLSDEAVSREGIYDDRFEG